MDPDATFGFAANAQSVAEGEVAFDMFGVELSHRGDECTFETLRDCFAVQDAGVEHLARLVHDLDMRDGRYEAPLADALGPIIDGLRLAEPDDGRSSDTGWCCSRRSICRRSARCRSRAMATGATPDLTLPRVDRAEVPCWLPFCSP